MKHSFSFNMMGLFCGLLAISCLGSVDLSVSATLSKLVLAAVLLVVSGMLLSAGLRPSRQASKANQTAKVARPCGGKQIAFHKAA